jgi:hypothetical protein
MEVAMTADTVSNLNHDKNYALLEETKLAAGHEVLHTPNVN